MLIRPDPERLRRNSVMGTAPEVAQGSKGIAQTPMTELIVVMQLPGLDPAKARRSLDRFAADVLPPLALASIRKIKSRSYPGAFPYI